MRIHSGLAAAVGSLTKGAAAIGNLDGLHLGHQALFAAGRAACARSGGPLVAVTFEPHPAHLLAPALAPARICTPARKQELLAAARVDDLVLQHFDRAFAHTAANEFVDALIALGLADVVVGQDFTYGRDRSGGIESLRAQLEERGVHLHVIAPVTVGGLVVSSTKVRQFALEGRVEAAAALLGRPLDLDGEVVRGAGRGRTLGWPTANLQTKNELLPSIGVYAVRARVRAEDGAFGPAWPAAANLGLNPTFREGAAQAGAGERLMLEAFLIDFAGDLYGKTVRLEFVHRLREERRFNGVDALKAQIARDVEAARAVLGRPGGQL